MPLLPLPCPLLACSAGPSCGPGTHLSGDQCLPDAATPGATSASASTWGACSDVDVWEVQVQPDADPVNRVGLEVALDGVADVEITCELVEAPPTWSTELASGWSWRYRYGGEAPPEGWNAPGFDDGDWASAPSPLGYGYEVGTELDGGADPEDRPLAAWFRTDFELAGAAEVREARLVVQRDDGVVVWLNGVEVLRDNLPSGELAPDDTALGTISGEEEGVPVEVGIDPGLLVEGENVLAAEVHQASPSSSDLLFDLELALARPGEAEPERHVLRSAAPAPIHRLSLDGLLAEAVYDCTATTSCPREAPQAFTVATAPLPEGLPDLQVVVPADPDTWGDYVLLNHQRPCIQDYVNRLLVLDHQGRVRWYHELPGLDVPSTIDLESQLLPDGTIFWGGGDQPEGTPAIVDLAGDTTYVSTYPGVEGDVYHHDVEWTDEGRILGIVNTSERWDGVDYEGFALVEHDPATGEVTWRWESATAVERGQLVPDGSDDPFHANSLAAIDDADGPAVYVSLMSTDEIVRIDRATGDVTWHLGRHGEFALVDPDGAPLDTSDWFSGLHAIDAIAPDRIMLYDNGWAREASRAVELVLDTAARVATLAWTYEEPGWYEPVWGDADEVPGGQKLIDMAHAWCKGGTASHPGAIVQVDPATGEVLWRLEYLDVDDSGYRAQKLDGCDIFHNATACPDLLRAARRRAEAAGAGGSAQSPSPPSSR